MGRWHVLREPAVPILLLACVVHAVRRNLFDLLLFAGTAVLIIADAWRPASGQHRGAPAAAPHRDGPPARVAWLAVIAFALLAGPLPRDSGWMQIVLSALGVVALAVIVRGRAAAGRRPRRSARGWQVWAVLGVLACLWELTSFAIQQADPATDAAHPTVSDLLGPALASWPGRVVFLALWAAAGWWLLHRVREGAADVPAPPGRDGARARPRRPRRRTHHGPAGKPGAMR